jgi:hypothetical protein
MQGPGSIVSTFNAGLQDSKPVASHGDFRDEKAVVLLLDRRTVIHMLKLEARAR